MTDKTTNPIISTDFCWESAAITNTGAVRKVNEDAIMSNDSQGHWVEADGMGGHNAGDVASQEVCAAVEKIQQTHDFAGFVESIETAMRSVNQMLVDMAEQEGGLIGSTVVGLAFHNDHAVSYWAGDSRVYLLRDKALSQITVDHTAVQEMLDAGQITADQVSTHPEKNIITRAVGSETSLIIDFLMTEVMDGDLFIVCSDGVEKELSDSEVEALLNQQYSSIEACAQELIDQTLSRGARDNVSVALIRFSKIAHK